MEASALTQASRSGLLVRRSPLLRLQSDQRLVELIREHHDRAFEVLFDRYQGRLLAFCRGMLGCAEDAEDVLQDVFVNAHAAMLADSRPLNVRPWLYRIARNRCLNHLRRPGADGQDSMDGHPAGDGASTLERVQHREELRAIFADVAELPETQRTALVLREIDDLSYEEIAAAMETSLGAVKSLLVRARMALAEASEGRVLDCGVVRLHLAEAAEGLRRVDGPTRYHVRKCVGCRRYRGELRSSSRALAALAPLAPLWALPKTLFAKLFGGSGSSGTATGAGAGAGGGGTGAGVGAGGAAGAGVSGAGATGAIGSAGATGVIGGAGATAGATGAVGSAAAGAGTALGGGGLAAGGGLSGLTGAGSVLGAAGAKVATGFATAALVTAGAVGVQHEFAKRGHDPAPPAHTAAVTPATAPADHPVAPPATPAPADSTATAPATPPTPPTPATPPATTPAPPAAAAPPPAASSPTSPDTGAPAVPDPQSAATPVTGAGNPDGQAAAPVHGRGGVGPLTDDPSVPVVVSPPVALPPPDPGPPPPAASPPVATLPVPNPASAPPVVQQPPLPTG